MPLSYSQRGLWLLSQNEQAGAIYHIPGALRIRGDLDRAALRRSLDALMARHEALRTVFDSVDGEPQVRLLPPDTALPSVEHDLRGHGDAQAELRRLADAEASAPFSLAQGPLIRSRLIRTSEDEHVLLLTQHHIVSDGWSAGVLARELSALYAAFQQGQDDPLPPLPIQYPDYAAWQRGWLDAQRLSAQTDHWGQALAGAPALLELPTDRPRPPLQDYSGSHLPFSLDAELTRALKRLSQQHGTTLFITLLAAWAAVLAKLSGQQDIVIGTPTANRSHPDTQGLIGYFVNTLALRLDLAGSPTVAELLERARAVVSSAQEHRDLPFEKVMEAVQPPRHLSHTPIFQVLFNWDDEISLPAQASNIHVTPVATHYEVSRYDLKLNFSERDDVLHGTLIYATALFDAATVQRHADYIETVLRAMVADSGRPLAAIDVLAPRERSQLLTEWNATEAWYPQDRSVHGLFEEQAQRTPQAPAVIHGARTLSYAQVNEQANRLAHRLIELGAGAQARVAICADRSPAMVIAMLAVLKSGAAYVPLDPAYPSERLAQVLADAAPGLVLSDAAGRAALGEAALDGRTALDLEPLCGEGDGATAWSDRPASDPQVAGATSSDLAYVIYTSGSTGTPKGVMVEHRSLVNFHQAMRERIYRGDRALRIGWNASFSFDMSMKGFLQLLSGHALVIVPQQVRASSAEFLAFLRTQAIDGFDVTPSLLKSLIGEGLLDAPERRTVLIGGEAIDAALWDQLRGCGTIEFHNMYGPTECTVDATMSAIGADDAVPHIGRPLSNMRIYLLDEAGQPVPRGTAGEVYIGGVGVARGYLNREELTAERFVRDPFCGEDGGRMYRTGDLARYLADGRLAYLGRNDGQVKIRGFRIELGEIDARLNEYEQVREAVVQARESGGEKRLVAYVVASQETVETASLVSGLRARLAAVLPDYMVPSAFVRLESLPLTANGKLDRRSLPAPDDEAYARGAYEAPQGEMEGALAQLWRELLGIERVGRQDDFFELGGHSLLAVRMLVRIRQSLGAELPVLTLFAHSTLAKMAQAVIDAGGAQAAPSLPPIPTVPRDAPLPLSFAQQRLWFLSQWQGVSAIYHIPNALRLRGALDREALRRSLDALMARHEGLRSVFEATDGQPYVRLLPASTAMPLMEHDLSAAADAAERLAALREEESHAAFDLAQGPLIRARLIRMAEDDHVLLLTQHHIVSDGWSNGVLSRELGELYRGYRQGRESSLAPLPIQYPDYAAWQRSWLDDERLQRQTEYWRGALADAPVLLELPTDRPRPAQQAFVAAHVPVLIDAELTRAVKRVSQQHGTTLFMTLTAAWAAVLARLSGQNDLVIGTPTANRARAETEGLIGFFVNTLALRVDLDGAPSVAELLSRVRSAALAAQDNQDLPFEQIVELVQPPRRTDHTPIFQALINWHNNDVEVPELEGLRVAMDASAYEVVKFDVELSLSELDGTIAGSLSYATSLFDADTMRRHVGYLRTMLQAMADDCGRSVDSIGLLPGEERELLAGWNDTATDYRRDCTMHRLFEEQAQRTPDATAVRFEALRLSYRELNEQANRLAHHLIEAGVRAGDPVAICVERSAAMIVGVLAIVKAGGAYVPLDPAYPSGRLGQVLEDAAPAALLADAAGRLALGDVIAAVATVLDLEALRPGNDLAAPWASRSGADPHVDGLTPSQLAYVIYTSGSTGKPKGVMGTHLPAINLIEWVNGRFRVGPEDVVLLTSSLSFDLSVYDIFGLLAAGGCIHVASREEVGDPRRLARMLFAEGITFWDSAPAVFQQLLFYLEEAGRDGESALRLAFFSGDWIPLEFFDAIRRAFPRCEMIGLGGATEATVWSNFYPVERIDPHWVSIPYGRPIQNARYYVLDAHLNAMPIGSRGDLYIGGECLTAGYFGREDLTAERFVPDPHGTAPDARMYKTGDLARYRADGNMEFLGRNDFQVKIRGFRIELGEVDARLAEHAAVRESVVVARKDGTGEKRLIAYVVPADPGADAAGLAASLRTHMAARLPDYMVPSAFVRIEGLPLTPNGKIDRDRLPDPGSEAFAQRVYEEPQGEVESAIARIWQEVLGVERVGRGDNFFELGGHSLIAVRVVERLRQDNIQVEMRSLFVAPILRDFALKANELEEIRL
ncbi:amino acid adenylation domain-containing protein [Lysobacter enzymogenes]